MADESTITKTSKFLSYILRHKPEDAGITLDSGGWAKVKDLENIPDMEIEVIEEIVRTDDKGRYSFSDDKKMLRANQGHSIKVDLGLVPKEPPEFLYHGTPKYNSGKIQKKGIKKQKRNHVHLSTDFTTAMHVGIRRGHSSVVFKVSTKKMFDEGHTFFLSENGVWLTEYVPPEYLYNMMAKDI